MRQFKRWSEEELSLLSFLWGSVSTKIISRRLGRTVTAILNMAYRLDLGPPSRGMKSLNRFCRETGYHPQQVRYALLNLGLMLHHTPDTRPPDSGPRKYRHHAITFEQEEAILEYLSKHPDGEPVYCNQAGHKTKQGVWGVGNKPERCLDCQRTDRPHRGHGLCGTCHRRSLRKKPATTACSFNRSYPTLCQAQAYIDGLNAAGQTGEYSVIHSPDRYAPCGAWYEVVRETGGTVPTTPQPSTTKITWCRAS